MAKISEIVHPQYSEMQQLWEKYRYTLEGGSSFVEKYTKKFSTREDETDFITRKEITYCPGHAKAALIDIKNAIFQRMIDINRKGGTPSYMLAVTGADKGVDLNGNSMDSFIGRLILPELLALGRVGVYVDRPALENALTLRDTSRLRPFVYYYKAEDIRSWSQNKNMELTSILLRDTMYSEDPDTGLVTGTLTKYRLLKLSESGVDVFLFSDEGVLENQTTLKLTRIPFVIFEITQSLLTDVADYQVTLLNLASSDVNYAVKSNFPFYTEQFNPISENPYLRQASTTGEASDAGTATAQAIDVGPAQGRRYPRGVERPAFIHPSAEPLRASMDKQDILKNEIRQLVNLALTNIDPRRASAESKQIDEHGLEAGLSYIGLELEYGERQIAELWAEYESKAVDGLMVQYPANYSLRTDSDRRKEADDLCKLISKVPSVTFQREIAKQVATILIGTKVDSVKLDTIISEIDSSPVVVADPEIVKLDHEAGFVSTETASKIRGYPEGEVEQAKKDHAERAAAIMAAQSGARGVQDLDADSDSARKEKEESRQTTFDATPTKKVRGDGDGLRD